MADLVDQAIAFAREFHDGQMYGEFEYFEGHLEPVARRVIRLGYDDEATVAAAYLHNTIKGATNNTEILRSRGIPSAVIEAVEAVSHRDEAKLQYLGMIASVPRALVIEFADSTESLLTTVNNLDPADGCYIARLRKYTENLILLEPLLPAPNELKPT